VRSFNSNTTAMSRWVRQTSRWVSGGALAGRDGLDRQLCRLSFSYTIS